MFLTQFVAASAAVLFLPGWLFNRLVARADRFSLLESLPYAFGSSMGLLTAIAIASFTLHLSFATSANAVLGVIVVMLALEVRRVRRKRRETDAVEPVGRSERMLTALAIVLLAVVVVVGQRIEMPEPGQEDASSLVPAQQILRSSALTINGIFYGRGDIVPYLLPVQSYAQALIAHWGQLETLQVYYKLRFVLGLVAITATYAMVLLLAPRRRWLGAATLAVCCALQWNGWGIQYGAGVFGQFFPYTEYHDFTLSALLPVAVLCFLRAIDEDWRWTLLTLSVGLAMLFVHPREAVIFILLAVSAIAALVLMRERRDSIVRSIAAAGILGAGGAVLPNWIYSMFMPPELVAFGSSARIDAAQRLAERWHGPVLGLLYPPITDNQFVTGFDFLLHPVYLTAVFLLPVLFYCVRDRLVVAISVMLLAIMMLSTIPALTLALITATYGPFMFGAPATLGIFPIGYVLCAAYAGLVLRATAHVLRGLGIGWLRIACMALLSAVALLATVTVARLLYQSQPAAFYLWSYGGALLAIALRVIPRPAAGFTLGSLNSGTEGAAALPLALILVPCIAFGVALPPNPMPGLLKVAQKYRETPSIGRWHEWYPQSPYKGLPWEMVRFIRNNVPPERVFLAPGYHCRPGTPPFLFHLPELTDQYVYSTGTYISITLPNSYARLEALRGIPQGAVIMNDDAVRRPYLEKRNPGLLVYSKALQIYGALVLYYDEFVCQHQPVFNDTDTVASARPVIDGLGIEYILVPQVWRADFERRFAEWVPPAQRNTRWWEFGGVLLVKVAAD